MKRNNILKLSAVLILSALLSLYLVSAAELSDVGFSGELSAAEQTAIDNTELSDILFSGDSSALQESKVEKKTSVLLDVPYINQRAHYPNGCESVSAVMALNYFGVNISPNEFISKYLDMGKAPFSKDGKLYGCNPREAFPGDPRNSSGWGCYPEVIKKAVDKMELENIEAFILKDVPLSTLCTEYLDAGIPVVFWGTINMLSPSSYLSWEIEGSGEAHTWITPFHCLLLVGYDETYYYFNDPWRQKNQKYEKDKVEIAYCGIGREALVLLENE